MNRKSSAARLTISERSPALRGNQLGDREALSPSQPTGISATRDGLSSKPGNVQSERLSQPGGAGALNASNRSKIGAACDGSRNARRDVRSELQGSTEAAGAPNRLNPIPAAGSPAGSHAVAPSPPFGGAAATYSMRSEECPDCDRAVTIRCDTCWSSGEVDAACADCGNVYPLNADGVCEHCHDAGELPGVEFNAKWLCPHVRRAGAARIEL